MAKTSVSFAQFFYRVNPDSTIDAICGYCFLTVATANTRTELRLFESAHHCGNSLSTRAVLTRLGFGNLSSSQTGSSRSPAPQSLWQLRHWIAPLSRNRCFGSRQGWGIG